MKRVRFAPKVAATFCVVSDARAVLRDKIERGRKEEERKREEETDPTDRYLGGTVALPALQFLIRSIVQRHASAMPSWKLHKGCALTKAARKIGEN